jgi:hypothetical protein
MFRDGSPESRRGGGGPARAPVGARVLGALQQQVALADGLPVVGDVLAVVEEQDALWGGGGGAGFGRGRRVRCIGCTGRCAAGLEEAMLLLAASAGHGRTRSHLLDSGTDAACPTAHAPMASSSRSEARSPGPLPRAVPRPPPRQPLSRMVLYSH